MNLRWLGIAAILGAPFLFITMLINPAPVENFQPTLSDGICSFLYISGWMCSIVGLWKAEATGTSRWSRLVLVIQLVFLSLADISNILIILPNLVPRNVFLVFDIFWPVSNIWMLATGITVLVAKRLARPQRLVPLIVGLWVPVQGTLMLIFGKTPVSLWGGGLYSVLAWTLLGIMVYQMEAKQTFSKPYMA